MAPVDIGRDAARDAAAAELSKPAYPTESPVAQLVDLLDRWRTRIIDGAGAVAGGWFTVTVVAIVVVVALVVAARIAGRAMRSGATAAPLLDAAGRSAAEHRALAERAAADHDWAAAIRYRLRAVARELEDRGVLAATPGRTATELAADAGVRWPAVAEALRDAATLFNDVAYGERPATADGYRLVADLDDRLGDRPPMVAAASRTEAGWAPVR